jgi:DNA gyrase subunit A
MKDCDKIAKSKALIEKKLIEELREVGERITSWVKMKDQEKIQLQKKIEKDVNKKNVKKKLKH